MIDLIQSRLDELKQACRDHHVQRLELFGSGASGNFNSASDLDFLVEFQPLEPVAHARAYFDLLFAIEDMFGRQVDLVERKAISNPYFLGVIKPQRTVLYAA
jgi:uncharacterized protein